MIEVSLYAEKFIKRNEMKKLFTAIALSITSVVLFAQNTHEEFARNTAGWTDCREELSAKCPYYLYKNRDGQESVMRVQWSIDSTKFYVSEFYYWCKAASPQYCIQELWAQRSWPKSWYEKNASMFLDEAQKILWENKQRRKLEEKDAMSKQGWYLVGRYGYDRSIRLGEIRDSLMLLIGLLDDTDGNINLKYLAVEPSDYPSFEQKMSVVNEKFAQWTLTAQKNNVVNFKKTMPVNFGNEVGYLSVGLFEEYVTTELYAVFEVDDMGKCSLRIDFWEDYDPRSGSYESQLHEPYITFSSPEEFRDFYEQMKYSNAFENYKRVKEMVEAANRVEQNRDAMFN